MIFKQSDEKSSSFLPLLKQQTCLTKSLIPLSSAKHHGNYDTGTGDYQYQYFLETKKVSTSETNDSKATVRRISMLATV